MTPEILYEDNHLIVVNKPFGTLTHGDHTGDFSLEDHLKRYIKHKYNKPGNVFLKSVHRLDRPVSGALVFARTSKGHERMAAKFRERKVDKKYWALSAEPPGDHEGIVKQYLRKDASKNIVTWSSSPKKGGREAVTKYQLLMSLSPNYLTELLPVTGRSHQLRAAMRSMGCPILGDVKYKGAQISNPRAITLHARALQFMHPVKTEELISVIAPVPMLPEWSRVREALADQTELDPPFGLALR